MAPPMVKMPDLTNGSLKNALMILKNFDLKFGKTKYVADLAFNAVLIQKMKGVEVLGKLPSVTGKIPTLSNLVKIGIPVGVAIQQGNFNQGKTTEEKEED